MGSGCNPLALHVLWIASHVTFVYMAEVYLSSRKLMWCSHLIYEAHHKNVLKKNPTTTISIASSVYSLQNS